MKPTKKDSTRIYDHVAIEQKWQKYWESKKLFNAKDPDKNKQKKFYALIEFPFPSGDGLHVGHIKSNTAMDIISRKRRMEGYNVLYPIGWDAFGLPTENYAIKTGLQPAVVTKQNTDIFRRQLKALGFSFDWSREINTTDPKYYKWTQWIFLQLLKEGLAYKKKMAINWCPKDLIGLANEEVVDGKCERCGTPVEKREKEQWMLAITKYAERLDKDLDETDFLEKIKIQQRNWIGKSEGAEIDFPLVIKENKPRFVLLHGFEGSARANFFPWLKKTLEDRGYEVDCPELPNSMDPKESEQVDYVIKTCTFNENTVIIGHSLGAVVAQKVIMKLNRPVSGLVIIASAIDPKFGTDSRPFQKNFNWDYDYELIKKMTGGKIAVLSDSKEPDRAPYLKHLSEKLGAWLVETTSVEEHFCAQEEPEVLKAVTPLVKVFTTRPDTLYGVTYIVLSPEHQWVGEMLPRLKNRAEVETYVASIQKKSDIERTAVDKEKTGVELKGVMAINPATGEEVPVWIADYVLSDYGTGAVMAVPAHDERDSVFAQKYNLPMKEVCDAEGILVDSGGFTGRNSNEVKKEITDSVGGKWVTKFKLRDWVFSRQRYWGEPIPVVHCEKCGIVPLPEKELPLELPAVENYKPTETGESPLASITEWVNTKCPTCKGKARRETDTMPNWAGSSWYYLRYVDPHNKKAFAGKDALDYWTPVDWYNGGMEHTTLHLLYSRFWHKFLYDIKQVPTTEPYQKRTSQGLILAVGGEKMSKSKGNVVNPDKSVALVGADAFRLYEMFMGPFDQHIAWDENGIVGTRRFIEKVWRLGEKVGETRSSETLMHKAIKKVSEDIESMRFNTAISTMMITVNELEKQSTVAHEDFEILLKLLSPFAPHVAEELWNELGNKKSIILSEWPAFDPAKIIESTSKIMVQVNGKTRSDFEIAAGAGDDELKNMALNMPEIKKWIENKDIKKIIVVKGRLVNIVT